VGRSQDNAEKLATEFVLKTLKKRLFSSPAAFLTTLDQHEKSLRLAQRGKAVRKPSVSILKRELDRVDEDYANDGEYDEAMTDAVDAASLLFTEPTTEELALLRQMRVWAEKATAQLDSEVSKLIEWLNTHLRPGKKWGAERGIIFTEYRATQNWLLEILAQRGFTGGERLMTMYGGMDSDEREEVKAAFQSAPDISLVRILLATDAAAEGLNLQNHCYRLIHYEIPWNPNRLEQRNGRIDRHGQKGFLAEGGERHVYVYHFVGKGYKDRQRSAFSARAADLDADLEFLMRVAQKVETIREDLGSYGTVLADDVEQAMLGRGYSMPGAGKADAKVEPVRKMLKFEQDIRKRCAELEAQYRETRQELRLTPANIQQVVEVALALAEQPALIPPSPDSEKLVFTVPALKHSWAACAEGLEHPHTKQIRSITFDEEVAKGRDDVVLVHLNHRLVQMSLRLLRAEVWSVKGRKRLHRITARLVPNHALNTPAVIAHARLVVVGGDSHRLHEEIITAGGLLKEGRFSRMNLGELDKVLAAATGDEPAEPMRAHLLELWDKFAPTLATVLETRMRDRAIGLQKKLGERAEKEAEDIRAILLELKKAIDAERAEQANHQPTLFDDLETDQFERNKDFLQARSKAIPAEIERETAALKSRYDNPQPRMFPVAMTFLVPEKMRRG
jgi:hypothetical protein